MKQIVIFLVLFNFLTPLFAQWQSIFLFDAGGFYYASSELEKPDNRMNTGRYSPRNLLDHDSATAWVEGEKDSGIGTYVFLGIGTSLKNNIIVYNGYQQSENLFKKNNRVKDLKLTFYVGFYNTDEEGQFGVDLTAAAYEDSSIITLQDKIGPQVIDILFELEKIRVFNEKERKQYLIDYKKVLPDMGSENPPEEVLFVKFEILSVYEGSTWDDTCIAEIEFSNREMGEFIPLNESINEVYQDDKSGNILIRTWGNKILVLANARNIALENGYSGEGEFLTLSLMDASPDKSWAVINYQHGFTGGGHIEETYQLWSVLRMERVPDSILQAYGVTSIDVMTFVTKNDRLFLETIQGKTIRLEDMDMDMKNLSRY
jgi:hypothetical protein